MGDPVDYAHLVQGYDFTPSMSWGASFVKSVADTGRARVLVHWDDHGYIEYAVADYDDLRSMINGQDSGWLWRDVTGSRIRQATMYMHELDRPLPPPRLDGPAGCCPAGRGLTPEEAALVAAVEGGFDGAGRRGAGILVLGAAEIDEGRLRTDMTRHSAIVNGSDPGQGGDVDPPGIRSVNAYVSPAHRLDGSDRGLTVSGRGRRLVSWDYDLTVTGTDGGAGVPRGVSVPYRVWISDNDSDDWKTLRALSLSSESMGSLVELSRIPADRYLHGMLQLLCAVGFRLDDAVYRYRVGGGAAPKASAATPPAHDAAAGPQDVDGGPSPRGAVAP